MDQFIEHAQNLVTLLVGAHAFAVVIVNLTPTPKDDEAIAKAYRLIEIFAGLVTKVAKK
tara:strand:+ start:1016 stop:1192 length:177 start_codon:yes stop_codon:yes gene_type:complete